MRVILCSKNFAANKNISHIGLGVSALNTCKTLIQEGIPCEVWQIVSAAELTSRLQRDESKKPKTPITHIVISAPWILTKDLELLCHQYPSIHFAVNCHSNVGFLQADPNGMKLLREGLDLEMAVPNFSLSANSKKMAHWIEDAYKNPCAVLPNLYFLNGMDKHHRPLYHGGVLRLGCFGAIRPQKNLASAVAAGIEISYELKAPTEIWISSGRSEGGGNTILSTVREMVRGLPTVSLRESGWQSWPSFRSLVGSMHLLLQPSYTESFNMVSADGIAEGVATVVSDAIDWVPSSWIAHADDVFSIAHVGRMLLHNHHAAKEGLQALESYVKNGIFHWKDYLKRTLKP